uniref:RING finger protein unkempt n=2 Tax=Cacopsylla melanoneura TaxID=428564 RepID=A0A8D9A931_9HEMI
MRSRQSYNNKMPSESKPVLTAQTEKPNHYSYLKEFRVEQCPLFLQHKCTQHRPFTCFHWHFMNQRRRRPVRKRDGSFNYSPDTYCTKYDETTGLCPDGDDCPFLHRTAGDTERRYHLRYYKTCMCVHDTDARGLCVKNGAHCAFAHGNPDLRPPVYDIKEIQALENPEGDSISNSNGPNALDKEGKLLTEDPKWQDTIHVLTNYKTEPCKRPPRLCRQGYACPQYHNSRDKRRSPHTFKYRSTPCPNVKHGDEWGEPANCESGDLCQYCHTRTEQQFHPEIYKSTKCNDVQQAGYCPRGVFCAFAHVDTEMANAREMQGEGGMPMGGGGGLSDMLSSGMPNNNLDDALLLMHQQSSHNPRDELLCNGNSHHDDPMLDSSEASTSSSNSEASLGLSGPDRAPGAHLAQARLTLVENQDVIRKQLLAIESDPTLEIHEKLQRKQVLLQTVLNSTTNNSSSGGSTHHFGGPLESIVGNSLDELSIADSLNLVVKSIADQFNSESSSNHNQLDASTNNPLAGHHLSNSIFSNSMSSQPISIPTGTSSALNSSNFSPTPSSPLSHFLSSSRPPGFGNTADNLNQLDSNTNNALFNHISQNQFSNTGFGAFSSNNPTSGAPPPPGVTAPAGNDFNQRSSPLPCPPGGLPPPGGLTSSMPLLAEQRAKLLEVEHARIAEEALMMFSRLKTYESRLLHAKQTIESWQNECDELVRRVCIVEKQRDEALNQVKQYEKEVARLTGTPSIVCLSSMADLKNMSISALKHVQSTLRGDLEQVDKILYLQTATKCMVCEERHRNVTLGPCNHLVVCSACAPHSKDCPYCQTPVTTHSTSN